MAIRYNRINKERYVFAAGCNRFSCLALLFFILAGTTLKAQLKPSYLFSFDKINTGIKPFNQTVLCMAQDSIGFMWFGASNGLYRYDGNTFDLFEFKELKDDEISSLLVDSKKNIWIAATWDQLFKYDMYSNKLTHYIFDTSVMGMNNSQVFKICEGKNNTMWLAGASGIMSINTATGKFTTYSTDAARSICLYNDTLWAGLTKGGIKCLDPGTGKQLNTPARWQFLSNPDYIVNTLYPGKNDHLWAGTNLGLFLQDENWGIKKFSSAAKDGQALPDNYITSIIDELDPGYTWICTAKGMALYENALHNTVPIQSNTYSSSFSIVNKTGNSLCRDASGKIWMGTDKAGIFSFYPRKIKAYRHIDNNAGSLHSNDLKRVFIFNNNTLATVYSDGVDLVNLQNEQCSFYPFHNTINPSFSTVQYPSARDDRSIFIGSELGLFIFDIVSHTYAQAIPQKYNSQLHYINSALYDGNKDLWIGCVQDQGGLYRYNAASGSLYKFEDNKKGLLLSNINELVLDDEGNVVVSNFGSVQKYINATDSFIYMVEDGERLYASAGICFQTGANGVSFAGTYQKGLFFVDKNLQVLGNIDESKGLSSNSVLSFMLEKPNTLWASTTTGINKIIFKNDSLKTVASVTHFDNTDGMPGEIVVNMVSRQHAGNTTYYLATNNGLVEAGPTSFVANDFKPPVAITSLAISDTIISPFHPTHILSIPVYLTKNITLAYYQNSLQLTFAALNYINSQKNQYAYKMIGVDNDWRYTYRDYSASYSNLRPGSYTFLVKASNDAGVWNETPASLTFVIEPPFWQTIWAYILYVIGAAAMVYGVYRSRISQYKVKQETQLRTMIATQEQERKRISRDLHDDIGTKLSALKLFVSSFKNNLQKQQYEETEILADSTESLIDETIKDVRVMLMNLSPGILEEFGYFTAVEGLVNKINETKIIYIKLVIFGITRRFAKDYELALYRITQELVNNVLKHAAAKNVSLQIGYRDEKIILMIEDDGKGFDIYAHKEGYGLKNLEARTKILQGTMNIDSSTGNGTSVLIEVPYQFN